MATVRYKANEVTQPSQADLNRLNAIKDEDIDCSDIPKLTEDFLKEHETLESMSVKDALADIKKMAERVEEDKNTHSKID